MYHVSTLPCASDSIIVKRTRVSKNFQFKVKNSLEKKMSFSHNFDALNRDMAVFWAFSHIIPKYGQIHWACVSHEKKNLSGTWDEFLRSIIDGTLMRNTIVERNWNISGGPYFSMMSKFASLVNGQFCSLVSRETSSLGLQILLQLWLTKTGPDFCKTTEKPAVRSNDANIKPIFLVNSRIFQK